MEGARRKTPEPEGRVIEQNGDVEEMGRGSWKG